MRKFKILGVSSRPTLIPRSAIVASSTTPDAGRSEVDLFSLLDAGRRPPQSRHLLVQGAASSEDAGDSDVAATEITIQLQDAQPESSHLDITVNGAPLLGVMLDEARQTLTGVIPAGVVPPFRVEFVQADGSKTVFEPTSSRERGAIMTSSHANFASQLFIAINHMEADAGAAVAETASAPETVFGRLLGKQTNQPSEDKLKALAKAMDESGDMSNPDTGMPVGFVFFGQFIDHDLTLEARTQLGQAPADDTRVINFRTPRLELDSVYLHGQGVTPFLYDGSHRLIVGTECNSRDLPRTKAKVAIIGDPRNDENLFVSQVHGLFLQLHNYFMDQVSGGASATEEHFQEARRRCRHLYQHIIIDDYLPRIVDAATLEPLVDAFWNGALPGPVDWAGAPDMPFEFSAAAFRFGHSQVRDAYRLNASKSAELFEAGGFGEVPEVRNLDWRFFFDFGDGKVQYARPIDTKISTALLNLPHRVAEGGPPSLPERNLVRGQLTFQLPFGEDVASAWGFKVIDLHPLVADSGLDKTPLWFYVLAEAEAHGGKLGPVGGTIVAGTLLNMMLRDASSIANLGSEGDAVDELGAVTRPTMSEIAALVS